MFEKIDVTKFIKKCLSIRELNSSELAGRLGITRQNLGNKYKRNDMKLSDLEHIASVLDCRLQIDFIDNHTGLPLTKKEN